MLAAPRHLPPPHIRVIERPRNLAELQPEKAARTAEHRPQHRLQPEVWLQRRLIQVMLGHAPLLGIIPPIPRLQRPRHAIRPQHPFQNTRIRQRLPLRRLPDPHQQIAHRLRRLRHLGFQLECRETAVSQQLRPLLPQSQYLRRDAAVIRRPAIRPARDPGLIGHPPQLPPRGKLQERHDQGPAQRDNRPVLPPLTPRLPRRIHHETGQPFQILLRQQHEPRALIRQQVLRKLRPQHRQPRLHRRQPLRRRPLQLRPRPHEHPPIQRQHPHLLRIQPQPVPPRPKILDPREQPLVVGDLRCEGAHLRRQVPHQRLARLGGIRPGKVVEDPRHPVQHPFRQFQRGNRIGVTRRLRLIRDPGNRCPRLGQPRIEGRPEIPVRNLGKGRQSERRGPGGKQRIGHVTGLLCASKLGTPPRNVHPFVSAQIPIAPSPPRTTPAHRAGLPPPSSGEGRGGGRLPRARRLALFPRLQALFQPPHQQAQPDRHGQVDQRRHVIGLEILEIPRRRDFGQLRHIPHPQHGYQR